MTEKKRASGLGRGLSDLLGDSSVLNEDISELDRVKQHKMVSIDLLAPSPFQPRHTFDEESLNNLVDSIKEKGVLQPLLVRRDPNDNTRYEIIAGERRFRASQIAELKELPVIVKEMSDQEVLEVALIENIQRQDLNAIEEAEGYNRLIEEFNHTQEELSKIVGKSRSHVANTMRLLTLSPKIQNYVIEGKLTAGHARALITAKNPEEIAEKVISKGLNVRQVEKLAQETEKKPTSKTNTEQKLDDAKALSQEVEKMIGTKVSIKFKDRGGEITIAFDNNVILDILLKRLTEEGLLVDNGVLNHEKKETAEAVQTEETAVQTEVVPEAATVNEPDTLTQPEEPVQNISSTVETTSDNNGVSAIVDTIMGDDVTQTVQTDDMQAVSEVSPATEEELTPELQTAGTENVLPAEEVPVNVPADPVVENLSQEQIVTDNSVPAENDMATAETTPVTTEETPVIEDLPPEMTVAETPVAQEIMQQPVPPVTENPAPAPAAPQPQQQGMTKEEVEKLLQETIEDIKPNFAGLENIITDDGNKEFKIPDKQEIIFDENVKI